MGDTDSYLLRKSRTLQNIKWGGGSTRADYSGRARAVVGGQRRARCCRSDGRARDVIMQVSLRRVSLRDTPLFRGRFYSNANRLWAWLFVGSERGQGPVLCLRGIARDLS